MAKRRTVLEVEKFDVELQESGENFDFCFEMFLKDMTLRNLSYQTKWWYKENLSIVKRSLSELNYPTEPINITENMLKDVLVYCMDKLKNNPTTINHRIMSMKQFFSFLHKNFIIPTNPTLQLQKQKSKKERIQPFSEDEVRELLNQPDKRNFVGFRDYTILLVLLDTGVRLCELVNMKVKDISINNNKILVLRKVNKEREVPFQETTKQQLTKLLKHRKFKALEQKGMVINNTHNIEIEYTT